MLQNPPVNFSEWIKDTSQFNGDFMKNHYGESNEGYESNKSNERYESNESNEVDV